LEQAPDGGPHEGDGLISVVVPTYNRQAQLSRVLGAYLTQAGLREVIVVDNGSSDGTPELLRSWCAREPLLRVVRLETNRRQAGARNAGAEAALGEFVFYGEDDYEPTPGHLAVLSDHLSRSGADIIAGRRINVLPGEGYREALVRVGGYLDPLIEGWAMVGNHHMDTGLDVAAPMLDACALIRKEVFRSVSFDMGYLGNGWREETDFQIGALACGFRLVHCPHTLGFHTPGGMGRATGGSRGRSRVNYEVWVFRNNLRFLRKQWHFLRRNPAGLKVAPTPELTAAIQAGLRLARAARKASRLSGGRPEGVATQRIG
jgi:glycosyltransferase involved in cell wall biosynthesis